MSPVQTEEERRAEWNRATEHIANTPTAVLLAEGIGEGQVLTGSVCRDAPRGWLWLLCVEWPERWSGKNSLFIELALEHRLKELPHGWEPTEEAAEVAVQKVAVTLGTSANPSRGAYHSAIRSTWLKRDLDRDRRKERAARGAERNKDKRGSGTVEYLYDWRSDKHRILKRTRQRIYYHRRAERRDDGTCAPDLELEGRVSFVSLANVDVPYDRVHTNYRAMYTEAGWQRYCTEDAADKVHRHEEWRQMRRDRWGAAAEESDYRRNHEQDEAEYQRNRRRAGLAPADPADGDDNGRYTVKRCRHEMQKHHPDKGGEREQFELWCKRLEVAKATRSRPAD